MLTDHGSKFGILLDKDLEGVPRAEKHTSAGTALFENGQAVVPDDLRGNEIAHELMETARYNQQINYHPSREGGTLKRGIHQVMWRMPAWNNACRYPGCTNEAEIQMRCLDHWGKYG